MAPRRRRAKYPQVTISRPLPGHPNYVDWEKISGHELAFEDRFACRPRTHDQRCSPRTPPGTPPRSQQPRQEESIETRASGSPEAVVRTPEVPSSRRSPTGGGRSSDGGVSSPGSGTALPHGLEETPPRFGDVPASRSRQGFDPHVFRHSAVKTSTPLPGSSLLPQPEAGVSAVKSGRSPRTPASILEEGPLTTFERSLLRRLPRALPGSLASDPSALVTVFCPSSSPTSAREPIDHLLSLCGQRSATTFEEALRISETRECTKLGEGSYGEVYRIRRHGGVASAVKVVPVEGSVRYNDDDQMTIKDVLPEVVVSRELSNLRQGTDNRCENFVELKKVYCIRDEYHPALLRAWGEYNDQKGSENDNPDTLPSDQTYVAFEYGDSGEELERYKVPSLAVARGIVLQVTCALAVAECELRFEHRDLHHSNILVAPCVDTHVEFAVEGCTVRVPSHGILVTLIDFTLSRMQKGTGVIYMDLAKGDFFDGKGNPQFDVYRIMRERTGNEWRRFVPSTNALWLHHLASQLLKRKYGKAAHRDKNYELLRKWSAALAKEESATEFFWKCRAGRPSLFGRKGRRPRRPPPPSPRRETLLPRK